MTRDGQGLPPKQIAIISSRFAAASFSKPARWGRLGEAWPITYRLVSLVFYDVVDIFMLHKFMLFLDNVVQTNVRYFFIYVS